jgi:hypothetical protein
MEFSFFFSLVVLLKPSHHKPNRQQAQLKNSVKMYSHLCLHTYINATIYLAFFFVTFAIIFSIYKLLLLGPVTTGQATYYQTNGSSELEENISTYQFLKINQS